MAFAGKPRVVGVKVCMASNSEDGGSGDFGEERQFLEWGEGGGGGGGGDERE